MRKLPILIFLCCSFPLFAQRKKAVYFNENNQPISEKEYRKGENDYSEFLHLNYETDTSRMFVIERRENRGMLPPETVQAIRKDLEESVGINIDPTHIVVINYYPGADPCNSSTNSTPTYLRKQHREYLKALHPLAPLDQFNIYSDSSGLHDLYYGAVPWYPDLHKRIQNTFFPLHYPCGSFVVIHPNGHYKSYKGEYAFSQIFNAVRTADGKDRGVLEKDTGN